MITVMGATGNTGGRIAKSLLKQGHEVRAIGRNEERLAELRALGAEVRIGDTMDTDFLADAFDGSAAVYTLLHTDPRSPDYRAAQDQHGEAIVAALRSSAIPYVVALSSLGVDQGEDTGAIAGIAAQEERLRQLEDVNVLLLRPVSFFENFFEAIELIQTQGIIADSVNADMPIPMIATQDIAAVAVEALAARDWKGVVVRDLLGERDLSYSEATRIIGDRIGRPDLAYVQLPYDEMTLALVQAGMSQSFARLYTEMTRSFNEGRVGTEPARIPDNTTPTTFEQFADEFAALLATA
ncbi:MAG: NAD(P)H-binding protein [Planctomycetes bacterium]|nr:NAD(P)H-binding protein [Planctomycetota bacterium]